MEMIKGLPLEIKNVRDSEIEELYNQTEKLYLIGGSELIYHAAKQLGNYRIFENSTSYLIELAQLNIEVKKGEPLKSYPIMASIQFFRRQQDDMIVATAYSCGMVNHSDIFEKKLIKRFPQVYADRRNKLYWDSAAESNFIYCFEEEVKSRTAILKQIINDLA